jgi:membrane dipeptidase
LLHALAIRAMVAVNPEIFALTTEADNANKVRMSVKQIVYMSIENTYPFCTDINLLEKFYKFGLCMTKIVHVKNNQFGYSSSDPDSIERDDLSPIGVKLVAEVNHIGIVLDGSRAHDVTVKDMFRLSKPPIFCLIPLARPFTSTHVILMTRC